VSPSVAYNWDSEYLHLRSVWPWLAQPHSFYTLSICTTGLETDDFVTEMSLLFFDEEGRLDLDRSYGSLLDWAQLSTVDRRFWARKLKHARRYAIDNDLPERHLVPKVFDVEGLNPCVALQRLQDTLSALVVQEGSDVVNCFLVGHSLIRFVLPTLGRAFATVNDGFYVDIGNVVDLPLLHGAFTGRIPPNMFETPEAYYSFVSRLNEWGPGLRFMVRDLDLQMPAPFQTDSEVQYDSYRKAKAVGDVWNFFRMKLKGE
jgi:hypothetical protein